MVSPDCVLYVISDTHPDGPDVQQLRQLRSDMPPPKNFNQLSGWTTGPHVGRGKAGNWQHLDDVRWIEDASGDLFPLVGSAQNAMKIFNARLGTSYAVDASFYKLLSGERAFAGGWRRLTGREADEARADARGRANGSSLLHLRAQGPASSVASATSEAGGEPAVDPRAAGARMQPVRDGAFEPHCPADIATLLNRINPVLCARVLPKTRSPSRRPAGCRRSDARGLRLLCGCWFGTGAP